jgi:serine/threonine protein kinase
VPCKVREAKIFLPVCSALLSFPLAHTEAFEKAKILHRDISVGNVIISDRGGLLIDWDLAKDVEDLEKISRQPFRTVRLAFDNSHD